MKKNRLVRRSRDVVARYPIRAVSKLTGISIDTLRAWERRHAAVTPVRDDRGRLYTDADIERLRLLHRALAHGHSIGRLAALSNEDLRDLAGEPGASAAPSRDHAKSTAVDAAALAAALQRYDASAIDREMARLAAVLRPLDLLRDALMPALAQVGDDWHRRRASIAQEHLMSSTMRNILGSFLRVYARPNAQARLLFATPAGERHEIGTLGAALLAASSGLGVSYLGPDLPAEDLVESVRPAGAQVLVLGLTRMPAAHATERQLRTVVRDLPPDVELWVGGRGARNYASIIHPRGRAFDDYAAYQQELIRLGGQTA
jgi:DNA-binding transcriptional MerR regulator/methylmalonyl-CoA mutase cobalamin-binding subunit